MAKRRCTFCGLAAHGTRRGVLRCATRAGRLVRSFGAELELETVKHVTYFYRARASSRGRDARS